MTTRQQPPSSLEDKNSASLVSTSDQGFKTPLAPFTEARAVCGMRLGQHVIAVVLPAVAAIRAITDGTHPALVLSAAGLFLACYFFGVQAAPHRGGGRRPHLWLLVLSLVWVGCVVVSAEFVWVAFLLWLLAGHLLRWRTSIAFSLAVFLVVVLAPVMHHGTTSYANVFGPLIGGVFALVISRGYLELLKDAREREALVTTLQRTQTELLGLQDELALSQHQAGAMAERTRISRDLHDTVAQSLTSIRMLALAEGTKAKDAPSQTALSQIETIARESLADVRRIVAALAPTELEDHALGEALRRIVDRFRQDTGLRIELNIDATVPALSPEVNVVLMRITQSALANVKQHAHASFVVVSLVDAADTVRLDILDDGKGMDTTALAGTSRSDNSGYGLEFMRSRLRELGGGLDLESTPGEGTVISAHVPLRKDF